ncbi:Sif2p SCDLUD_000714 [Saccharomycodes ludwigii]|uniref:Sif2p n=1 Tax=Saccharomycodes ludwigii TaxID=36035 RepID=UPI001E831BDD|nr:hypothetical protein SCDLUD_000714 [Saccharomycodes ludwigii]KAH3903102.1 hypothetical protein SCDLUD_000714 [Saccharomycodes ludwigii]
MSLTSEELNYLIYRYLQETGHEVSSLALQEETRVLEFEKKFKERIPLGCLVSLVQKGILYTESELLVRYDGKVMPVDPENYKKNFTLAQALQVDKEQFPEISNTGRFALENDSEAEEEKLKEGKDEENSQIIDGTHKAGNSDEDEGFIKALESIFSYGSSNACEWSGSYFAWSEKTPTNSAKIVRLKSNKEFSVPTVLTYPTVGKSTDTASNNTSNNLAGEITAISWSRSGDRLLTGVESGGIRLWTLDGKLSNIFNMHKAPIITMKWSDTGMHCITMDVDNVTIVWNTLTGSPVQHFDLKEVINNFGESLGIDCEWIEKDKFVIPGLNGAILLFQINNSNEPIGRLLGHSKTITCLSYNESNKLLLSSSDDNTIRIWRGHNSNASHCLMGHSQGVVNASWMKNNDKIISCSLDGSVRCWTILKDGAGDIAAKDGGANNYANNNNAMFACSLIDDIPIVYGCISPDKSMYCVGRLDGQVIVYNLELLKKNMEELENIVSKKTTNDAITVPLEIPIKAEYSVPISKPNNYVCAISWCETNDLLSVSYAENQSYVFRL